MDIIKRLEELERSNEAQRNKAKEDIDAAQKSIDAAQQSLVAADKTAVTLGQLKDVVEEKKGLDEKIERLLAEIDIEGYNNDQEKSKSKKDKKGLITGLLIGAGVTGLILGGVKLVKEAKIGNFTLVNNKTVSDTVNNNGNRGLFSYNYKDNVALLNKEDGEVLTTNKFNELTTVLTNDLRTRGLNISDGDVRKFMMIVHIDKLAETNKDLIVEIMGEQTADEVKQDAYKVIGEIVMYNYNTYYTENKTDNFIRISNYVFGTKSSDVLKKVEERVDLISKEKDNNKLNYLVTNLLRDLTNPASELSYTEDGIGFAMQISLEPVRGLFGMDMRGKNLLDKTNKDLIKYFVSYAGDGEEYVNNNILNGHIRNIADLMSECQSKTDSKKLTK